MMPSPVQGTQAQCWHKNKKENDARQGLLHACPFPTSADCRWELELLPLLGMLLVPGDAHRGAALTKVHILCQAPSVRQNFLLNCLQSVAQSVALESA